MATQNVQMTSRAIPSMNFKSVNYEGMDAIATRVMSKGQWHEFMNVLSEIVEAADDLNDAAERVGVHEFEGDREQVMYEILWMISYMKENTVPENPDENVELDTDFCRVVTSNLLSRLDGYQPIYTIKFTGDLEPESPGEYTIRWESYEEVKERRGYGDWLISRPELVNRIQAEESNLEEA